MNTQEKYVYHGSLFSGIGGFDLAAEWIGWKNVFHCEINEFCTKILNYHFTNAEHYADIKKTDFTKWRGKIDVLSGGFPCQPFSVAGKRKGTDDDRYLWPEMLRAIQEIRPTWIVGENVAGIISMVQPGKEVEMGYQYSIFGEDNRKRVLLRQEYIIETICKDIEREGYRVQPIVIPACAVGATHRRDRVWFVANRTDTGVESMQQEMEEDKKGVRSDIFRKTEGFVGKQPVTHTESTGLSACVKRQREKQSWRRNERTCIPPNWRDFPTQSPVCGGDDGLPSKLDGITFPKWREESLKAYGNAVVPQVAYEIFKAIQETYYKL